MTNPEYVTKEHFDEVTAALSGQLAQVTYLSQLLIWVQGKQRGPRPTPPLPPPKVITAEELTEKRQAQRDHLAKRRAERDAA